MPAKLNFILNHTKASKAFYVGHSQGTSALLVLLSMLPQYNEKIIEAHLLTPAAFFQSATYSIFSMSARNANVFMVSSLTLLVIKEHPLI